MAKTTTAWIVGTFGFALPALAIAHISVPSGPGFANTTQEVTFGVGHGCEVDGDHLDTYSVQVDIPASVTTVRAVPSDFGKVNVHTNTAGLVDTVTWTKSSDTDVAAGDPNYYKLSLRLKVPDQPFTKLLFPTHQTCLKKDKTPFTVHWTAATEPGDAGGPSVAPALAILPARTSGWNKFKVPVDIADLKSFFADAAIVWRGNSAYSNNPNTVEMIKSTADVTALTSLQANDDVWVKY